MGFNLGPQKVQNTFFPPSFGWIWFLAVSKLTHPIQVSLWADAQESARTGVGGGQDHHIRQDWIN